MHVEYNCFHIQRHCLLFLNLTVQMVLILFSITVSLTARQITGLYKKSAFFNKVYH